MINKTFDGSKFEAYVKFFEILNVIQSNSEVKLQGREIEVLSCFLLLPEIEYKHKRFKLQGQKFVAEKLNIKVQNVKTMLTNITKKKYITTDFDQVKYLNKGIKVHIDNINNTGTFNINLKFNINE